jgi:hypothetical protein
VTDDQITPETGSVQVTGGSWGLVYAPYLDHLFTSARRLIGDGHFQTAVLVAHMACEASRAR